jgi:hypothetical protein
LSIRVALVGFAAYRLGRAVALDSITDPLRGWVHKRAYRVHRPRPGTKEPVATVRSRPWSWAYGLVSCAFCASWWIALGLAALWFGAWTVAFVVSAIAGAGVASVLVAFDQRSA